MDDSNVTPMPPRPPAELARKLRASTRGPVPRELALAQLVNPGWIHHVATITDMDGLAIPVYADHDSVRIGLYRLTRDHMPELWAAVGEAAWQAGVNEQAMRDEGRYDEDGPMATPEQQAASIAALDALRDKLNGGAT